jgi:hypothetical protein
MCGRYVTSRAKGDLLSYFDTKGNSGPELIEPAP